MLRLIGGPCGVGWSTGQRRGELSGAAQRSSGGDHGRRKRDEADWWGRAASGTGERAGGVQRGLGQRGGEKLDRGVGKWAARFGLPRLG